MRRALDRNGWTLLLLAALLTLPAACGPRGEESPPPAEAAAAPAPATRPAVETEIPERVRKAADIAKAIQADPDATDRILEDHGMSREELEDLLYEIAADPALSEAYVRALEG